LSPQTHNLNVQPVPPRLRSEDVDQAVAEILKLQFGKSSVSDPTAAAAAISQETPSQVRRASGDDLVTFDEFVEIFRTRARVQENIEASHLLRRWLALCDVEVNFTVDFPSGEDDHITIRPHIDSKSATGAASSLNRSSDRDDAAPAAAMSAIDLAGRFVVGVVVVVVPKYVPTSE
jgi:hypothetical protein